MLLVQAPLSETVFVRWAAPEVLVESRYSTKSDVWSLGIVFWEVFSGASVPYSAFESLEQVAVHVASASGGRLDRPTGPCPDDLWTVMRSCWRHRPADRPSPAAVYDRLRNGRSKIYAGLASLGDVLPSDGWKMSNGGVRNLAAAATGVPQSSAAIAAPVVVDRRNLPLPLEPKTGRSPIKPENGFSGSFLVQCPDLPPPHSAAKDRSASSSTAVDKQSATREKRWSGGNGSKVQQGPLSTCVTPTQSQQTSLLPSSPSWETASVASVAVMGSHERSNRLRHSFMNRFFSGNHRKHKKVPSLSAVPAATAEVDKRL
jgi:serine/threonine protein kinase